MNETSVTLMTMRFEIPLHAQESNASECAAVPLTTGSKKVPKTLFSYIHTPTPRRGENFTLVYVAHPLVSPAAPTPPPACAPFQGIINFYLQLQSRNHIFRVASAAAETRF
jgi:hypothetical protein